ncbi:MAG: sigma 54-interacting transcriptional regulator [Devosiaceae bacterium]
MLENQPHTIASIGSDAQSIAEANVLPCLVIDVEQGQIAGANTKAEKLLAHAPVKGQPVTELFPNQMADLIVFTGAVEHYGESWTRALHPVSGKGEAIDVELHGRALGNTGARLLALQLVDIQAYEGRAKAVMTNQVHARGLTEWDRVRDFFREMENENRLILDAAGEGIYGVNLEGKTTFVNNAAQDMLGWTADDLLGEDIHAMIHHHHIDGTSYPSRECPIYHSFRNEHVARVEDEVFWHKDGHPIQVEYVSTPIYDQKVLAGAVVIFRDITDRRESESKLRSAMEQIDALKTKLEQENEYLQEEIRSVRSHYDLVGSSPAILRTVAQVELVADTQSNVLITGESGTGKALVASAIHKASSRAKRPMIRINCAAIPSSTFESELFGHIRGAFQGALQDRTGKLELANGGTLFLDQVAEIPTELQGKILRTLQDKTLERMGENRTHKINVRVIASSSTDLAQALKNGSFRKDLYFYLNVFPIECQPLRNRSEDIPSLTRHFLKVTCERLNLPLPTLTKANVQQLQAYHWPGNVRELQNVIERGAILARGDKLVLDLPQTVAKTIGLSKAGTRNVQALSGEVLTEHKLDALHRQAIVDCLKRADGKISGQNGAAAIMGIRPTTFSSRVQKFKIQKSDWDLRTET